MKPIATAPRSVKTVDVPKRAARQGRSEKLKRVDSREQSALRPGPEKGYVNARATATHGLPSQVTGTVAAKVVAYDFDSSDTDTSVEETPSSQSDTGSSQEIEQKAMPVAIEQEESEESDIEDYTPISVTTELMLMAGASEEWVKRMLTLYPDWRYESDYFSAPSDVPEDFEQEQTKACYVLLRAWGMPEEKAAKWCVAGLHCIEYWIDGSVRKTVDRIYEEAEIPLEPKTFPKLIGTGTGRTVLGKGQVSDVVKLELLDSASGKAASVVFKESSLDKPGGTIAQAAGVYDYGFQPEVRNICFYEVGKALGFSVSNADLMWASMGIIDNKLGLVMSEGRGQELGQHDLNFRLAHPAFEFFFMDFHEGDNDSLRRVGAHSSSVRGHEVHLIGTKGAVPPLDGKPLFEDPQARRALSDLQMLCHLANETDNNARNFMVDISEGKPRFVRIDTDNGFGSRELMHFTKVEAHTSYFTAPRPPAISAELAKRILSDNFLDDMRAALSGTGLPRAHVQSFIRRCERAQDQLQSGVIRILKSPEEWHAMQFDDTQTSFVARFGRRLKS